MSTSYNWISRIKTILKKNKKQFIYTVVIGTMLNAMLTFPGFENL